MSGPLRVHGGPDASGAAAHDFSTNANACGPCPLALDAVRAADPTAYPDPAYRALRTRLARHHGVAADRILVAASASEFIFRVTAWAARRGMREVVLPTHAYGDYRHAAQAFGLRIRSRDAQASAWTAAPAERCHSLAGATPDRTVASAPSLDGAALARSIVWGCDPSSPCGSSDVGLEPALARGATVVLDRAYEPLRLAGACALREVDAAWQLWSPNKALGLTGVRAAYAIAPAGAAAQVAELEALAPSWPLGAHGVALLQAWCEPATHHWLQASRATLAAWKERQLALCRGLGWPVLASLSNFFVAKVPDLQSNLPRLRAHGIKLRDCASFGLPGHARLAVLAPAAQDALAHGWKAAQEQGA